MCERDGEDEHGEGGVGWRSECRWRDEPLAKFSDCDVNVSVAQVNAGLAVLAEWEDARDWDERKLVKRIYGAMKDSEKPLA